MAIKAYTLRSQTKAALLAKLAEQKTELASLRVAQINNGAPSKLARMYAFLTLIVSKSVRKAVARISTVISQTQREQLRIFYAGKKYQPLDLRAKKTRAIRRALKTEQLFAKSTRVKTRTSNFPMRRFAVTM